MIAEIVIGFIVGIVIAVPVWIVTPRHRPRFSCAARHRPARRGAVRAVPVALRGLLPDGARRA